MQRGGIAPVETRLQMQLLHGRTPGVVLILLKMKRIGSARHQGNGGSDVNDRVLDGNPAGVGRVQKHGERLLLEAYDIGTVDDRCETPIPWDHPEAAVFLDAGHVAQGWQRGIPVIEFRDVERLDQIMAAPELQVVCADMRDVDVETTPDLGNALLFIAEIGDRRAAAIGVEIVAMEHGFVVSGERHLTDARRVVLGQGSATECCCPCHQG